MTKTRQTHQSDLFQDLPRPSATRKTRKTRDDSAAPNRFEGVRISSLTDEEARSVCDLAASYLTKKLRKTDVLTSPEATRELLRLRVAPLPDEVFGCVWLDNRHRVIGLEEMFRGTVDGASVHPRVVTRRALEVNAAAVIFYHNHPSGIAEPSQADLRITARLKEALNLVETRVLDHLIVGEEITSLAERGLI